MKPLPAVLLVATMDTKGEEARFIKTCLESVGVSVLILDGGIMGMPAFPATVTRESVAEAAGRKLSDIQQLGHEGEAMSAMVEGAVNRALDLHRDGRIQGVIGLGGSMGTTLGSAVMRAMPLGFPKVMITTMASRDTRPFVGTRDILMLHSICDLSGLNRITRMILRNGAMALAGMVKETEPPSVQDRPLITISTLGTSEACAVGVRKILQADGYEVVTFHTVGSGGEAMEEMIQAGDVSGVADLSLHELMDHRFGGDYDAGPERGKAALKAGIPTVLAPGNIDFLVTGPLNHAKKRFPKRPCHTHNAAITVVRSLKEEVLEIAEVIADMCNRSAGPIAVLIPLKGFSAFDREGGPLYDPSIPPLFDRAFRDALVKPIRVASLPCHINDEPFAEAVARELTVLIKER
ncbi:MAG: Tm-1-like ATP-binding domain-containing protein [Deltaproteobacteria bacterium]|nr:Tm-1-like ATP-binding domain-containing protein [Deltaproteobacteria bacterium]MBW1817438.1 Tm-1-like ATP-binding domain-containing protein [Deltaproteobacteria bacterium]